MFDLIQRYTLWPFYVEHWEFFLLAPLLMVVGAWVRTRKDETTALYFAGAVVVSVYVYFYTVMLNPPMVSLICFVLIWLLISAGYAHSNRAKCRRHTQTLVRGKWIVGPYLSKGRLDNYDFDTRSNYPENACSIADLPITVYDAVGLRFYLHPEGSAYTGTSNGYMLDSRSVLQRLLGEPVKYSYGDRIVSPFKDSALPHTAFSPRSASAMRPQI